MKLNVICVRSLGIYLYCALLYFCIVGTEHDLLAWMYAYINIISEQCGVLAVSSHNRLQINMYIVHAWMIYAKLLMPITFLFHFESWNEH